MGFGAVPPAAQRVPPLHGRPPPAGGGGTQACEHVRSVRRPDLLLVGALLHDLGKGGPGDHTENGVVLAGAVATRMGFEPDDVAVLTDLVRWHLLLPSFATGRDLDDPATVDAVVDAVGTEDMLDLLDALTVSDSLATGPTAWTPGRRSWWNGWWRGARELRRRVGEHDRHDEPAPARDPHLDAFDGSLVVEPRPGGVTLVAPDALGLLAIEVAVLGVQGKMSGGPVVHGRRRRHRRVRGRARTRP